MAAKVNRFKNSDFSQGSRTPAGWTWNGTPGASSWHRLDRAGIPAGGVCVKSARPAGRATWSQVVSCKPDEYYRIDAVARVDATVTDEHGGFVVGIEALGEEGVADSRCTPGIHHAEVPETVRAFYLVPQNARRLRISVGLVDAFGSAEIHAARFIPIIEPDDTSHPLAVPPPPHTLPEPLVVRTACVYSTAVGRGVTRLLRRILGERNVSALKPGSLRPSEVDAEAVLFPDSALPGSIRSLRALLKLAEGRIVVVSVPAFCGIAGGNLAFRRIEQPDDPIGAKIMYGCYATRGFALHDVFPYAWDGKAEASFAQNQFRGRSNVKRFCEKNGFEVLLHSMCDRDSTSEQPIALFRRTSGGALFVLDVEPIEAPGSTLNEPSLAGHLLFGLLGRTRPNLGQFVSPVYRESQIRAAFREMAQRIDAIHVHDADLPVDRVTEQLISVGSEDQSFGLPIEPKPVILVRSGLRSGDAESVYGAWTWFKQLVRPEPFACPYAEAVATAFRFAWVPLAARWDQRAGLIRRNDKPAIDTLIDLEDRSVAVMIDVVSRPNNCVRVCFPRRDEEFARYATWLPPLHAAFGPRTCFIRSVPPACDFGDRSAYDWRTVDTPIEVLVDRQGFDAPEYEALRNAGGGAIRIEVPGCDADFASCSIQRTDVVATALEHVVGLQYGLVAVNRTRSSVRFDGFAPVASGAALTVTRDHPALQQTAAAS